MRLEVCPSGLKATTRQHGLTEYWSHRISFCSAPQSYPKIFCWIYRHEGRKMKHELRCHAVICSKDAQCQEIATLLKQNLTIALREFKREKINKQNARLSLANAANENPSMPYRKILLSTGGNNYRPPLERSKSAPKLFAIEEIIDEEEDEEDCDEEMKVKRQEEKKKQADVKSCCKEDYLYPSVTLGRRRCRRGHSIRKSRLLRGSILNNQKSFPPSNVATITRNETPEVVDDENLCKSIESDLSVSSVPNQESQRKSLGGSDEDFESFLLYNNYDSKEPLSADLLSYFDMQLQTPNTSMLITSTTMSMSDLSENDLSLKNQRNSMSMSDLIDYQSDNELDDGESLVESFSGNFNFNQDSMLETLRQQSKPSNDENDLQQPLIHQTNDSTVSIGTNNKTYITKNGTLTKVVNGNVLRVAKSNHDDDSDELSDESGYVEFQDISLKSFYA
ncbi:CLUMA_CG006115, isoform A [Clunio marinus]|uniref:CLUMA_CG006115, isoform A n=1 Tax=Clunio marinus TaxID=568069 RepID=A0A1J1HX14_9DIPT|nr:CLUMA_CG006115, isoform A [Clunio marinus]